MPRFRDAGPSAPLVVEYHACELPSPPADVSIVCDGHAPFKQNYTRFRSDAADGILPASDLGDHGPLILAGFSEGCQGVGCGRTRGRGSLRLSCSGHGERSTD